MSGYDIHGLFISFYLQRACPGIKGALIAVGPIIVGLNDLDRLPLRAEAEAETDPPCFE